MPLESLHELLVEIQRLVAETTATARDDERARASRYDAINRPFAFLRALTDDGLPDVAACAEPGWVFLSSQAILNGNGNGGFTFDIAGAQGVAQFVFASGLAQADLIDAINRMTGTTGVRASQDSVCFDVVRLRSDLPGADEFVRVAQIEPWSPLIISTSGCDEEPHGDRTPLALIDWGAGVAGDVDCDADVDTDDLFRLLVAWGHCPPPCPPDIDGDGVVDTADLLVLLRNWTR